MCFCRLCYNSQWSWRRVLLMTGVPQWLVPQQPEIERCYYFDHRVLIYEIKVPILRIVNFISINNKDSNSEITIASHFIVNTFKYAIHREIFTCIWCKWPTKTWVISIIQKLKTGWYELQITQIIATRDAIAYAYATPL